MDAGSVGGGDSAALRRFLTVTGDEVEGGIHRFAGPSGQRLPCTGGGLGSKHFPRSREASGVPSAQEVRDWPGTEKARGLARQTSRSTGI